MLKSYYSIVLFILILSVSTVSCEWTKIEPINELPQNVSFNNDIIPIFNQSCNTSGCHGSGSIYPDLSESNAFNSLTGSDLINTSNPENSTLYIRMIDNQSPMPVSGILSKSVTDKIFVWIKEGANNN